MVPLEQEDQSQEEDHIPLLEGFQWDSLTDVSTSGPSRKRSLSESSLAPPPAHTLLTPQTSKQEAQEEAELRAFSTSEKMDGQHEPEREEEALASSLATALQRCDSVLGDSSSGTELCEGQGPGEGPGEGPGQGPGEGPGQGLGQGPGKRRRAAGVSNGTLSSSGALKQEV